MNNQLEDFINNNREEFDSEEMNADWKKIRYELAQKKTTIKKIKNYWYAVAAAVVILVAGTIYVTNMYRSKTVETAIQQPVELPSKEITDQVDPDYTVQMDQFATLITLKQNELKQNKNTQPILYEQFLKDNNQLDSSYKYLKSKLSANPNKEILLDAMIQNLQLKLDLLTRQLQIIKQSKNKKSNNENKTI